MEQIDKLFKDKFSDYQRPVSADAWQKLSNRRQGKKEKGLYFWMSIAASLTIFALAAGYFMSRTDYPSSDNQLSIALNDNEASEQAPEIIKDSNEASHTLPQTMEELKADNSNTKTATAKIKSSTTKSLETKEIPAVQESILEPLVNEVSIAEVTTEQHQEQPYYSETFKANPININIVLTGHATDMDALASSKYQDEEKNGLRPKMKKLLSKAQEIKFSEGALADLRMAKDEILAVDLKKDSFK